MISNVLNYYYVNVSSSVIVACRYLKIVSTYRHLHKKRQIELQGLVCNREH